VKHFYSWKRAGEHGWGVMGPHEDAGAAQAARDATAADFPGDEISAVFEADPATAWAGIPAVTALVSSGEGDMKVWSDGFTEVVGG
jgi:hypothetical protein